MLLSVPTVDVSAMQADNNNLGDFVESEIGALWCAFFRCKQLS